MMHFIKRMLESGIWNRESWASSSGRNMNFFYFISWNESTNPEEALIPATKMGLYFQTTS